jgi:tetratricopeptide (TPR) repeat protein
VPLPESSPDSAGPRTAWGPGLSLWGLLILTAAIYWPGLAGPLVLDDHSNLEPLMGMGSSIVAWQEVLSDTDRGIGARPLAMLTFVANWLTSGGEVWSLKYTNLLIHLLCGTLLFWLGGRLLGEPLAGVAGRRWWLALLVAALWLLAPMLVSTVLYVVQRMAQLATLFVIAGLLCYVIGRQRLTSHRPSGIGLMCVCFLVFWPLATLSKQNGALLPLLAALVEFSFFARPRAPGDRRLVNGLLAFVVGVPAVGAGVLLAVNPDILGGSYQARDFTIYERVLSEARILWDYAANLLMLPGGSPFGLFHDDFVISRGLLDPPATIIAIAGWIGLLVLAWRLRGGAWSAILFGPAFFLAAHLLESTVFPLELYFEHRNYLPSIGLFLSLGVVAGRLIQRTRLKRSFIAVVALVPLAHGVMTVARVVNWQSTETLLLAAARNHPDSPRVHTGLADLYLGRNDIDKAFEHLDRAGTLYGDRQSYAIALHRLNVFCSSGRPVDEQHYRELSAQPGISDTVYTANALRLLVENVEQEACASVDLARIAEKIHRDVSATSGPGESDRNWSLRVYTARLLALLGRRREAVEHALVAADLQPTWLEPGLLALEYQLQLGDREGARRTLAELKRRDKGRVALYTRLIEDYARRLE